MRGAQRVSDRRLRACLSDLVVHVIPVDRSSRRATVCVSYHARAQWSNSGLQVEDLKAAITPSHQPARSACSRNGKMSPPFRPLRSTTSSNLKKLFVVPRAIASCVGLRRDFSAWTERRVGNRVALRVSDESVGFPRHAPPRAGPRRVRAHTVCSCKVCDMHMCHSMLFVISLFRAPTRKTCRLS